MATYPGREQDVREMSIGKYHVRTYTTMVCGTNVSAIAQHPNRQKAIDKSVASYRTKTAKHIKSCTKGCK